MHLITKSQVSTFLFKQAVLAFLLCFIVLPSKANIVLLGDNAPHANVNDGDFSTVWSTWRKAEQSPFWRTRSGRLDDGADLSTGDQSGGKMGLHLGALYSNYTVGVAESKLLNTNPDYQQPKIGDVIHWEFGADLEYISDGRLSFSLVFGEHEHILANKVRLKGSDKKVEHFAGKYTVNKEDAKAGLPFVKVTFYTSHGVKVFLNYVNIYVEDPNKQGPKLSGKVVEQGIQLSWQANPLRTDKLFQVYRGLKDKKGLIHYKKIAETKKNTVVDSSFITGINYRYVVTSSNQQQTSSGSNKVTLVKKDSQPPLPVTQVKAQSFDAEIALSWQKSRSKDVASYSVYRADAKGNHQQQIAYHTTKNRFIDFTPNKGVKNQYFVYAHDYSGNKSKASKPILAKVNMVKGASFNDLILPMSIHKALRTDLWGAEGTIPRDADNGIEDPNWSYWGGRPVKGKDGKYHMQVTRWPANATKGHWEWPHSTVAYARSDKPTGPYQVIKDIAYPYMNGLGHNPDIVLLNDGRYMLYSLINWQPTLLVADRLQGPWQRLGVMNIDTTGAPEKPQAFYRFERNLSGVQLEDGRFLFVTKAGGMMMSQGRDPLGPYKVLTAPLQGNKIIPEKYRRSNYEDPVLWKDEVQYHMIINAFLDYRAIYLRSSDGIHWKFNPGTAYTPNDTVYEDGTRTHWYKLERPHVLTDEYGRATHLSLAVIDVPKEDDLARDNHSSKNIIVPLNVPKRLRILNKEPIDKQTKIIQVLVKSEPGFNAKTDIELASLRFGAAEEVDFGRGSKIAKTIKQGNDLLIHFYGEGHGFSEDNFAGKMLGKTKNGELLIGFAKR